MKHEIRFKGLNLSGDERAAQPGELSLCAGVELHDGTLRPSVLAGSRIAAGVKLHGHLLYVHQTQTYTHYITASDDDGDLNMYFAYVEGAGLVSKVLVSYSRFDYDDIRAIESVGNTLIIMTNTGLHYFLYKSTTGSYKYLGNRIPFVRLQFRPSTNYKAAYDRSTVDNNDPSPTVYDGWRAMTFDASDACTLSTSAKQVTIKSDKQADVTEAVWALINQTNDTIAKDGHFYAPFFIRYCYRLYDGSMVMHSAPVFMQVSLPLCYKVYSPNIHSRTPYTSGDMFFLDNSIKVMDYSGSFDFRVTRFTAHYVPNNVGIRFRMTAESAADLGTLRNDWSDIVKSIDIFVSPQIVREDSSQKIQRMIVEDNQYGVRDSVLQSWMSGWIKNGDATVRSNVIFDIPMLSDEAYTQKIRDTSTFYKIKSFQLTDSFSTSWRDMEYDKSVIPYITTQEQMTDDYKTHNLLRPVGTGGGMYAYNHRLNVFGCREILFNGFHLDDMVNVVSSTAITGWKSVALVVVEIDTDDGKKYVETYPGSVLPTYSICNTPFFYPDARATRMVMFDTSRNVVASLKMEPCNMLNGSMATPFFLDFTIGDKSALTYASDTFAPLLNKIYTSEVNNPYYFPLEGINTVGVGSILGLAATTRALSQGQFGQYPLMAFCTDGIWALQVSSTGTYSSIHPISREVCINPDSICQLDQSVMFATDRALSRVVESTVASISDMLDGPMVQCGDLLPRLLDYFDPLIGDDPADQKQRGAVYDLIQFATPPIDYFKQGRVLYDFTNSRVMVLPRALPKDNSFPVYVFSLRDLSWSTMLLPPLRAAVNSYPYPYVQRADGSLMVLDTHYDYADLEAYPGIIVTRPLSFAAVMQALQAYDQQHDSQSRQLLFVYGSNDLRQWHYIGRSQRNHASYVAAHAFRYFRIALYLQLRTSERYSSVIIDIIEKYRKL